MKNLKRVFSCFAAAALTCSVSAFAACGSGNEGGSNNNGNNNGGETSQVSDVVSKSEWDAAFADESLYNVTVNCKNSGTTINNITYYSDGYSDNSHSSNITFDTDTTVNYDVAFTNDKILGNIYSYELWSGTTKFESSAESLDETSESTNYAYYLYNDNNYKFAHKGLSNGEESEWYYYADEYITSDMAMSVLDVSICYLSDVIGNAYVNYKDYVYKDGAYVCSIEYEYGNYLPGDWWDMTADEQQEYFEVTEFTGGVRTYTVVIKDGKLSSIKFTYSYTIDYTSHYILEYNQYESVTQTTEWTFSDYGSTSVNVPSEVTALFN